MLKKLLLSLALSTAALADVESLETRVSRMLDANQQKEAEEVVQKELERTNTLNKKREQRREQKVGTADLHALLSDVYTNMGKNDLALHEIGLARNEAPDVLLYQEQEAQCFFDAGLYTSCISATETLKEKLPEQSRAPTKRLNAHAHKRLADAQFITRFSPPPQFTPWQSIIEHYDAAIKHPDFVADDWVYSCRGLLLFESNQNDAALKDFTKALELNTQVSQHYEHLLYAFQRANRLGDLLTEVRKIRGVNDDIFYDAASDAMQSLCVAAMRQPSLPELKGYLRVTLQPDAGTIEFFTKLSENHQKNWLDYVKTFGKEDAEREPEWHLAVRYAYISGMLNAAKSISEHNSGSDAVTAFLQKTVPLYQPIASVIQLGPIMMVPSLQEYDFKGKDLVVELLSPHHLLNANRSSLNK